MRSRRFFHKKSSKNCPPGGVQIVGCEASAKAMRGAIEASVEMDGVIVTGVHDEFRGMGLSGVSRFLGDGAVVVDARGMIDAEEAEGERFCYSTSRM